MKFKVLIVLLATIGLFACDGDDDNGGSSRPANQLGSIEVSGDATVGSTLSATVADPNGLGSGNVAYAWFADGKLIADANTSTFVVTAEQIGANITARAVFQDADNYTESLTSAETAAVTTGGNDTAGSVAVAGNLALGLMATANISDPDGASLDVGEAPTYQWIRVDGADETNIAGATGASYTLTDDDVGKMLKVTATYTDDAGFRATVSSDASGAVGGAGVEGTVTLAGDLTVGSLLTATVADGDGLSGAITYQWAADGTDIADATAMTYTLTAEEKGKVVSVTASYMDDVGFSEAVTAMTSDPIVTIVVDGEITLTAALAAAADGDIIGLNSAGASDYAAMAQIDIATPNLTLRKMTGSTAQITGATCLNITADGVVLDGLEFDGVENLAGSACAGSGGNFIFVNADNATIRNCRFLGETTAAGRMAGDDFHWILLRSSNTVIERNYFSDSGNNVADFDGQLISFATDQTADSRVNNIVRYNHFENIGAEGDVATRASSAYAIGLGRSSGLDSTSDSGLKVEYNLFKNVFFDRRLVKVQSSGATVSYNTIIDSSGLIAFEDGQNNTANNNIIINSEASAENNDDGAIAVGPYGHTITNNYIAGLRSTSQDRGGIVLSQDWNDNAGNLSLTFTAVTVANNSIFNSREALEFTSRDCTTDTDENFIVDFDSNLIANGEDDGMAGAVGGRLANGTGRTAVTNQCVPAAGTDWDNNHIYSATFATNPPVLNFTTGMDGNIGVDDSEGGADVVIDASGNFFMGQNADAGIGADVSMLVKLEASQVGPNSTWAP